MSYNFEDIENYFNSFKKGKDYYFAEITNIQLNFNNIAESIHKDVIFFNFNGTPISGKISNSIEYIKYCNWVIEILKNGFNHKNQNLLFISNMGYKNNKDYPYYFYDFPNESLIIGTCVDMFRENNTIVIDIVDIIKYNGYSNRTK